MVERNKGQSKQTIHKREGRGEKIDQIKMSDATKKIELQGFCLLLVTKWPTSGSFSFRLDENQVFFYFFLFVFKNHFALFQSLYFSIPSWYFIIIQTCHFSQEWVGELCRLFVLFLFTLCIISSLLIFFPLNFHSQFLFLFYFI